MLFQVGSSGAVSAVDTLRKLATKVLLPLAIGQAMRRPLQSRGLLAGRKKLLSRVSETCLLAIVFSTFCDTFLRGFGLPLPTLAYLLGVILTMHAGFLAAAWQLGRAAQLPRDQRVTLTVCATQKTLALGLPLLQVVFAGRADLALLCTPLLIQHPLQLFVGSLLSSPLSRYAQSGDGA